MTPDHLPAVPPVVRPVVRPDGRLDPPQRAPERDVLGGVLDFLRGTVVLEARGLDEEQARRAAVPPSTLNVAGVVAHLTAVERFRFAIDFDELSRGDEGEFSLRYALAHMVEETGRHCGHLDLLREALDGTTGE